MNEAVWFTDTRKCTCSLFERFQGQITVECWNVKALSSFTKEGRLCPTCTASIGDRARTGQARCAWVALEKCCLREWALRRGISPLPLKQWALVLLLEQPAFHSAR